MKGARSHPPFDTKVTHYQTYVSIPGTNFCLQQIKKKKIKFAQKKWNLSIELWLYQQMAMPEEEMYSLRLFEH